MSNLLLEGLQLVTPRARGSNSSLRPRAHNAPLTEWQTRGAPSTAAACGPQPAAAQGVLAAHCPTLLVRSR